MAKQSFAFLMLTVVGGLLFALGMCMCLLPEWNAFCPGILFLATLAIINAVHNQKDGSPAYSGAKAISPASAMEQAPIRILRLCFCI